MSTNHDARLVGEMGMYGSVHHADEWMRCPTCNCSWPCEPFLEARLLGDYHARGARPAVVFPERRPGEVAGDAGRSSEAPLRAGRPGPRSA